MVFYFQCSEFPSYTIYMGKDKFENESLISWGFPDDVWFHVEHLSSAHVYVRPPADSSWDSLPTGLLEEMCQLVKHNSIEGSKKDSVEVVYTPWFNLKKNGDMAIGQVGFKDEKLVKRLKNISKNRDCIKRLERTKVELFPDLQRERIQHDKQAIEAKRRQQKELSLKEKELVKERMAEKALRSYDSLFSQEVNVDQDKGDGSILSCKQIEEDFM